MASSRWFLARRPSSAIHSQLAAELRVELLAGVELLLGEQAGLDPLGELDLLLGVEQRDLADLLEVVLDRVGGGAGRRDLLRGRVVVVVGEDERVLLLAASASVAARASAASRLGLLGSASTTSAVVLDLDLLDRRPPRPRGPRPRCPRQGRRGRRRAPRATSTSSSPSGGAAPRQSPSVSGMAAAAVGGLRGAASSRPSPAPRSPWPTLRAAAFAAPLAGRLRRRGRRRGASACSSRRRHAGPTARPVRRP